MPDITSIVDLSGKMRQVVYDVDYGEHTWASCHYWAQTKTEQVKRPKPSGWLFPLPYNCQILTKRRPHGIVASREGQGYPVQTGWTYTTYSGELGGFVDQGSEVLCLPSDYNLRDVGIIKAINKLNSDEVNFGVALAESKQVAEFVTSVYGRLAASASWMIKATSTKKLSRKVRDKYQKKAVRELHRYKRGHVIPDGLGVGKSFKRYHLPTVPRTWLEWQYAVKPLMSDATKAVKQLATRDNLEQWMVTVKDVRKYDQEDQTSVHTQPSVFAGVTTRDVHTLGYFTRLDYKPDDPLLIHLQRAGLLNVPVIIYEKTWMSFVVDWALPIGEWLQHLTAAIGFGFHSGSTSELKKSTRTYSLASFKPPGGAYPVQYLAASFQGRQRRVSLIRTVHYSSPIVARPRFKNPLSVVHVANGLSLLTQLANGYARKIVR